MLGCMADLRLIQRYMAERKPVVMEDGRVGRILRVDTAYPERSSTISVWIDTPGPGVAKVNIRDVRGPVRAA
jgi:hypothetical protein